MNASPILRRSSFLRGAVVLTAALAVPILFAAPAKPPGSAEYVLMVTGGEILDGSLVDAHIPLVTRALLPVGIRCVLVTVVDDLHEDMRAALQVATQRAPLVLVTGGLGPTVNDITREVLSAFTGIALAEEPTLLAEMARRFNQPVDELRENLRRQTQVPLKGGYLPNRRGTAPGLIFDAAPATIVALPGPPRELQPMVREALVPWLRQRLGLRDAGHSITLRFIGIGQSAIDAVMQRHLLLPPEVMVGSSFEGLRVDFMFSLPEDTPEARRQLRELALGLEQHLGAHIYATDTRITLEAVVLERLLELGESWALAEASGPHLAAALTRGSVAAPASSPRLHSLAATSEAELHRLFFKGGEPGQLAAEPGARAVDLAWIAREHSQSAWALALGEPVSDPAGRSTVWVAVVGPEGREEAWPVGAREPPETGWPSLVNDVLNQLRRFR